jgi:hypothetical protein
VSAAATARARDLLRRVEHEVRVATAWVAREPAAAATQARVRAAVGAVLLELGRAGALIGDVAEDRSFVRCDGTTTTQADLDAGRLVVLVGVAPVRPGEFEVLRIDLWTGDAWHRGGASFGEAVASARRQLRAVAEGVLAGPQHARSGTIRLRAVEAGFATVSAPSLAVRAGTLVAGHTLVPLRDATYGAVARAAGVEWRVPDLYGDHASAGPDDPVAIDPAAAVVVGDWLHLGAEVLRALAPEETPVLWPEHFDVAITLDAVNYGVSPGDSSLAEPYAYVGPHTPRTGDFWNAPFGAAQPLAALGGEAEVLAFFAQGRVLARGAS